MAAVPADSISAAGPFGKATFHAEGVRALPVRPRVQRYVYAVWRADADRRPSIRAAVRALQAAGGRIA